MKLITYAQSRNAYNTYATLRDIDSFREYYPIETLNFDKLPIAEKEMLLLIATKHLDNNYRFKYDKLDSSQNLEFPRNNNVNIPSTIVRATIIIAVKIANKHFEESKQDDNNIKSEKVGRTLKITYKNFTDNNIVKSLENPLIDYYLDIELQPHILKGIYLCRG